MQTVAGTLSHLIYNTKRTTLETKDIDSMLVSVFRSFGSRSIDAYTYHGAEIAYVWGNEVNGYGGVVVNATMREVTMMTQLSSIEIPEGWKKVNINDLRQCGALPHATA